MPQDPIFFKKTIDDLPGGKPLCDFCGEQDAVALFPARAFIVSLVIEDASYTQDFSDDGWVACSWCELLVKQNDVPRLVERFFLVNPMPPDLTPQTRALSRGLVSTQFNLFVEHRTGDPIPYPTAVTP